MTIRGFSWFGAKEIICGVRPLACKAYAPAYRASSLTPSPQLVIFITFMEIQFSHNESPFITTIHASVT